MTVARSRLVQEGLEGANASAFQIRFESAPDEARVAEYRIFAMAEDDLLNVKSPTATRSLALASRLWASASAFRWKRWPVPG